MENKIQTSRKSYNQDVMKYNLVIKIQDKKKQTLKSTSFLYGRGDLAQWLNEPIISIL